MSKFFRLIHWRWLVSMKSICISCNEARVSEYLNLGNQPVSNRYPVSVEEKLFTHTLKLGQCESCGLVQLIDPMPSNEVTPIYNWLTYNEPEEHLDSLVDSLCRKLDKESNPKILGITYKDDTTVARLEKKGLKKSHRLDVKEDLMIDKPLASLETIQFVLSQQKATEIVSRIGLSEVVIARHILEHAHNPREFIAAASTLCEPDGFIVIEVPDSVKVFKGGDHCFIWEEHISYFTNKTLGNFLAVAGFNDYEIYRYSYAAEDSLVAIVRNRTSQNSDAISYEKNEYKLFKSFASGFVDKKIKINQCLNNLRMEGKCIALFGAGHLSAKFVNLYEVSTSVVGIIDDNPNKLGRLMPGSGLPIIASSELVRQSIDICLLTLNPESEARVRKANAEYLEKGGEFVSIFSANLESLKKKYN
jgi:hypothetical protein